MSYRFSSIFVSCIISSCNPVSSPSPDSYNQAARSESRSTYSLCGKTTTSERIQKYFYQVAQFVENGRRSILQDLLADTVVVSSGDHSRRVASSVIVRRWPYLISTKDWVEISRRGESSLMSGGWRGCFLSNGKVGFSVDEDGYLRLSSFNPDMAWDSEPRPEEGSTLQ